MSSRKISKPHYTPKHLHVFENDQQHEIKINPRGLNIIWGADSRYWRMPEKDDDPAPAELLQVCWLEVSGSVKVPKPGKYEVSFTVSLTPDAFGWNDIPVIVMARAEKGTKSKKQGKLSEWGGGNKQFQIPLELTLEAEGTIHFGLYEVWSGKWKGGLKIHNAIVKKI